MLLKDIMKEAVVTCTVDATVRDAAKKLTNNRVGCLIVTERETVKGILTKSDIIRSLTERKDVDYCKVGEVMQGNVKSCPPDMNVHDGAKVMARNRVKRLPILEKEKLKGLVSISDLAPVLNKEVEEISSLFWK